jgi:aromatic-L-amino-acid/L-tryptophan decarboxylase
MDPDEFRRHAHRLADWMADYLASVERYPVRAQVEPGAIAGQLPATPPATGEPLERIMADFERILLPGMTHWQHPNFFAYFPANSSPPSVLAEMLTATLGAQCMLWQTSPAATELETRVLDWLRQMIGLPEGFAGVIQDSASSATLCAVLVARERATEWQANERGLAGGPPLCFYTSEEAHSSISRCAPTPSRQRSVRTSPMACGRPACSPASARPGSARSTRWRRSARSAGSTACISTSMPPGRAARCCSTSSAG